MTVSLVEMLGLDLLSKVGSKIAELESENAKLRELLKRCSSCVKYEIMDILNRGGVPVDHVQLIEEIDEAIGPLPKESE